MTNSDGHIILKTKVDTAGIKEGMGDIKSGVSHTSNALNKLRNVIVATFSARAIIQFSKETSNLATTTEASVKRITDIYGDAQSVVADFIDNNARAMGMSKSAAVSYSSVYGNLFSVWADGAQNAELTNQYLQMTAIVANKTGRTVEDVQERIRSGLLGNTEAIEDLGIFVNVKTIEMTDAFKRMADGRSWEQLTANEQMQVRTLAILEQSTMKYGTQVEKTTALTKARYQAAYEDFKNSWGQVVNTVLVPVMETLTDIFDFITYGIQKLTGKSTNISDMTEGQSKSIDSAVNSQNALTDAVEATSKAQDKVLAGFDQLNILQESSTSDGSGDSTASVLQTVGGTGFSTVAKAAVGEVKKEVSGLVEAWEDFYYKMTGEMSVAAALNYNNALLKFKNSSKDFISSLTGDNDIDFVELASDAANFSLKNSTGAFTALSGIMDIGAGFNSLDFETAYKGLGRLLGGGGMLNAQIGSLLGMGEDLSELYFPLSEEIPNLYKELTAYQAKALQNHNQLYSALKVELKDFTWGDTVIDDAAFNSLSASVEALFTNAAEQAENSKDEIISNLNAMVEKGYLSDGEAKTALKNADETAHKQRTTLKTNQKKVMEILKAASGERRSLTTSEREQVERLLSESNTTIIKSINTNNQRRIELESELNDAKTEIDKVRLSQVIQFANSEYEETVAVANKKYDDTIAEANRLYYDLGVINEAQYNDIVKKARETKNAEIKEAQESKTKLVKLAKEKAGEVADTVDPESGEILSNWELLWNRAYTKVKNVINDIIDTINSAIKGVNGVLGNSAPAALLKLDGTLGNSALAALLKLAGVENLPKIPQIPRLARGAVIPANREFLAVLGDQKNGRNLEAPEELIRKIVREETGGQQLTVKATGSMAQLIRLLRLEIQKEDTRSSIY